MKVLKVFKTLRDEDGLSLVLVKVNACLSVESFP